MTVSVIIPALNEEGTVADVVRACLADNPLEVLVIDADSSDATASRAAAAECPLRQRAAHLPAAAHNAAAVQAQP